MKIVDESETSFSLLFLTFVVAIEVLNVVFRWLRFPNLRSCQIVPWILFGCSFSEIEDHYVRHWTIHVYPEVILQRIDLLRCVDHLIFLGHSRRHKYRFQNWGSFPCVAENLVGRLIHRLDFLRDRASSMHPFPMVLKSLHRDSRSEYDHLFDWNLQG